MSLLNRRGFLERACIMAAAAVSSPLFASASDRSRRLHIGSQTNSWPIPLLDRSHLLEIIEKLHGVGYTGFETNIVNVGKLTDHVAARKDFESRGMPFVASHNSCHLIDAAAAPAELQRLEAVAQSTAQMGAGHLIVSPNGVPRVNGKLDPAAMRVRIDSMNRLGKICRKEGLKLCYHNESAEFQDDAEEMKLLLQGTDPKLVWMAFDVGNAFGTGPSAPEFSAAHFHRIAIYHMKDVVSVTNGRAVLSDFGEGRVDLAGVVAPLLNSNWKGWLIAERELPRGSAADPAEVQRHCREYLKKITGV